jgi:hypothetical protein
VTTCYAPEVQDAIESGAVQEAMRLGLISIKQPVRAQGRWGVSLAGLSPREKLLRRRRQQRDWSSRKRAAERALAGPRRFKVPIHRADFPEGPEGERAHQAAYMRAYRQLQRSNQ